MHEELRPGCKEANEATTKMGQRARPLLTSSLKTLSVYKTMSLPTSLLLVVIISVLPAAVSATGGAQIDDRIFQYTRGPVPQHFQVGMHYPSRNETEECRPIRLRIERDSRLFRTNLVVNTNSGIRFASNDAKRMTSRLQSRLNSLSTMFYAMYRVRFTVELAWVEYSPDDGVGDDQSLHYEGEQLFVAELFCTRMYSFIMDVGGAEYLVYEIVNSMVISVLKCV